MADAASAISRPPPALPATGRDAPPASTPPAADAQDAAPPPEPDAPNHDPAVRIAGRLAQLRTGVQLLGDVLLAQDEGRPLLRTAAGDFAVEPTRALPARGAVAIVLTRVTPDPQSDLAGLIVARDGAAVEPPQPVRLTLVTLPALAVDTAPPGESILARPHAIDTRLLPADAAASLAAHTDDGAAKPYSTLPQTAPVGLGLKLAAPAVSPPALDKPTPQPPQLPLAPKPTVAQALAPPGALATPAAQRSWTSASVLTLVPIEATLATLDAPPAGSAIRVSVLASEPPGADSSLLDAPPQTPLGRLLHEGRLLVATVLDAPDNSTRLAIGERLFTLPAEPSAPHLPHGTRLLLVLADPSPAPPHPLPPPRACPPELPASDCRYRRRLQDLRLRLSQKRRISTRRSAARRPMHPVHKKPMQSPRTA